ncbi:MAG: DUF1573 domain-containing protein [Bacteroidaceae bacterium]|nr:DUF1573 domain-containing protein [Bacteroidaceae bacterium]
MVSNSKQFKKTNCICWSYLLLSILLIACQGKRDNTNLTEKINSHHIIEERVKEISLIVDDTITTCFSFVNNSNFPLIIDTVRTSCGCTKVEYTHKPIEKRTKGLIKVNIDLEGYKGYFSKSLVVYFHNQPPEVLRIRGVKK